MFKCGWHRLNGKLYPIRYNGIAFCIFESVLITYDVDDYVNRYMLNPEEQEERILIATSRGYVHDVKTHWYYHESLYNYLIRELGLLKVAGRFSNGRWIWYASVTETYYILEELQTHKLNIESFTGTKGIPVSEEGLNEILSREGVEGVLWTDNHIVLLQYDGISIGYTPQPVESTWSVGDKFDIVRLIENGVDEI